ncbi:MAG: YqcI/YcgG family protein, partial [Rhizobacter sp.]
MLVRQRSLKAQVPSHSAYQWFAPLYAQFEERFVHPAGTPKGFPCVFAQNAVKRRNVVFSLVPLAQGGHDFDELAIDLSDYLDEGRDWDGSPNTSEPLLAVFEPQRTLLDTEGYSRLFNKALQHLIDHDPDPWPAHTHTDPQSPFWSMCFRSTQVFVNVSHPQHTNRRSRNLCDALVLVINPRERFDRVAGNHEKGHAVRAQIRHNVDLYDAVSRSPLLDHYLSGGLEWPQYDLPDTNEAAP